MEASSAFEPCHKMVDARQRSMSDGLGGAHTTSGVELGDMRTPASLTLAHVACRAAVYPCHCPDYVG
jgi:hypothetical protein